VLRINKAKYGPEFFIVAGVYYFMLFCASNKMGLTHRTKVLAIFLQNKGDFVIAVCVL
jgi:hypothetical protein